MQQNGEIIPDDESGQVGQQREVQGDQAKSNGTRTGETQAEVYQPLEQYPLKWDPKLPSSR